MIDDFADRYLAIEGFVPIEEGEVLRRLASEVMEGAIVEVGAWRGRSTFALWAGAQEGGRASIYSVEPHEEFTGIFGGDFGPPDRAAFYRNALATGSWDNVRLINLSSEAVTPGWSVPLGMLWIDGDHSYDAVRRDFDCWSPFLRPGCPLVLDDTIQDAGGPKRLVVELERAGWTVEERVGKVAVLRRSTS